MASDLKFKLNCNLESLAGIAAAIYFWDLPDVQQTLQNYFSKPSNDKWRFRSKWHKIRSKVCNIIRSFGLPEKISMELYTLADLIGDKIFCWYEYVIMELGLHCEFARKIYWTAYGGIDESRIFHDFWRNRPGFQSTKNRVNGLGSSLCMVACIFAQENFIKNNLKEMTRKIKMHYSETPVDEIYSVPHLMTVWLEFYFGTSKESEIWSTASKEGLNKAAKYLTNENSSEKNLGAVARVCLENITRKYFNRYKKEKLIDAFLFLLQEMPAEEKNDFLFGNIKLVLNAFLKVWPYQLYFSQILKFIAQNNTTKLKVVYPLMLEQLIETEKEKNWFVPSLYKNMGNGIFIEILEMMPKILKREVILDSEYRFCLRLFESSNYSILNFLLNDPDLFDLRDEIICQGDHYLQMYVETFKFYEIDTFMDKTQLTEEERNKLKNKFNPLWNVPLMSNCVFNGMFKEIDALLDWLSNSESERTDLKKNIISSEIILWIFESQLESDLHRGWNEFDLTKLDQYLEWQFHTEEERINFKLNLNLIEIYRGLSKKGCALGGFDPLFINEVLIWQFGVNNQEKIKEIKMEIELGD